jgi:hypothetical protein
MMRMKRNQLIKYLKNRGLPSCEKAAGILYFKKGNLRLKFRGIMKS